MKLIFSVALSCAILFATVFVTLNFVNDDPSTASIDADLVVVRGQMSDAQAEASRYSGSAILAVIELRLEILKTTEAMLDQKRTSLLRRIDLNYVVDGQRHTPDAGAIEAIEVDLAKVQAERDRHQAEAALYSGGLAQTMALMNASTSEMTISQLMLSLLAEKHGFLFPRRGEQTEAPIGQTIVEDDGDAL